MGTSISKISALGAVAFIENDVVSQMPRPSRCCMATPFTLNVPLSTKAYTPLLLFSIDNHYRYLYQNGQYGTKHLDESIPLRHVR